MAREKASHRDYEYEVAIIGGGIVGAGIFRDLSLHGISCLIVDQKDFGSQTSSKSSKMLHGGIRYLEQFDFPLVREALAEKNLWLKAAPHLCREMSFILPVYENSLRPLWMINIGLSLYDFLSHYTNTPHKILNKNGVLASSPQLLADGLKGAGVYHDVVVDDARMVQEIIASAILRPGQTALSHTELLAHSYDSHSHTLELRDNSGKLTKVKAKIVVFATGPFTDQLFKKLKSFPWNPVLLPTRGSHLWIEKKALDISAPIVLQMRDRRIIFVIPWEKATLVGTTEVAISGDYFDLDITDEETQYLLSAINQYFPMANVTKGNILGSFSGVRPLVKEEQESTATKTARDHKIYRPTHHSFVIVGGKYTTFRPMACDVGREICNLFNRPYSSLRSIPEKNRPF